MNRFLLVLLLLAGTPLGNAETPVPVAVIVSAESSVQLSRGEVANLFLGKDKSLRCLDIASWSAAKATFYALITNKGEAQLKAYWSGLIFTGKGQPPDTVANDAEMLARVASSDDTVGYVAADQVNDARVRVLFTLP